MPDTEPRIPPASVSAPTRQRELEILSAQVRILFQQYPIIVFAHMLAGTFLISVMWPRVSHGLLIAWLVAQFASLMYRLVLYSRFKAAGNDPARIASLGRRFSIGSVVTASLWGLAGWFTFLPDQLSFQTLIIALLIGVVAGSMTLTLRVGTFYAATLAILLPIAVRSALEGAFVNFVVSFGVLGFAAVALAFGRNLGRLTRESIVMRYENLDLIEQLRVEKRNADMARQEAETASRSKSRFLAAASHDLRQPLHALGLFAGALVEKAREPDIQTIGERITASVGSLEDLFNALLDISRLDAGVIKPNPRPCELQPLLQRLRQDFEGDAAAKLLHLRVRDTRLSVETDPTLLEMILRNLISNALRYTRRGGILVGVRHRNGRARIEVWDTGVGIAPEQLDRVFEEFYQIGNPERNRDRGLGLGLAIVRRLSQLMDCPLGLYSRPGRGSVFTLELPLCTPAVVELEPPTEIKALRPLHRLIVLLDDEEQVRAGTATLLESWGCRAIAAGTLDEALNALAVAGTLPHLILADYRLSAEITGIQAVERLRTELRAPIPAVLVTGDTAPDRLREAAARGYHLLHKPLSPARLRALINSDLQRFAPRPVTPAA